MIVQKSMQLKREKKKEFLNKKKRKFSSENIRNSTFSTNLC